jgi:YD repeat-containing protein
MFSTSDYFVYVRGETKLETEWLACQEYAKDLSKNNSSNFVVTRFSWWSAVNSWLCSATDVSNPGRTANVILRGIPKTEYRTDNCPDSHPIYNQAANNCNIDLSRNMGNSICSLGTNPIHGFTGNKYQVVNIYSSPNDSGLDFKWYYNSMTVDSQANWRHGYQKSISSDLEDKVNETASYAANLPTGVVASVSDADGNVYKFKNDISWSARSTVSELWGVVNNNGALQLETVTDPDSGQAVGFKFRARGGRIEEYTLDGRLLKIVNNDEKQVMITWSDDRIETVTDEFGNAIRFHYDDESGLLSDIQTDEGHYFQFSYHEQLLLEVMYPDDTPSNTADNPVREYRYEDTRYPTYLTSVIDENGNRSAYWSYDDQGRAILSGHAADSDQYTINYNDDGSTTIIGPLGNSRTYTFTNIDSLIRIGSSKGGECIQCGDSSKDREYDSKGFVVSRTDWNDTETIYERDDLGRELSRTEALGFPEERTVKTEWDTDINKPVRITEPDRITEFVYDDEGRLLSKTEQAAP